MNKEFEKLLENKKVFWYCISSTVVLRHEDLHEDAIRSLARERCENTDLSFDTLDRCVLTSLIKNNSSLKNGFQTVLEDLPEIMEKTDAKCCLVNSQEASDRCERKTDAIQQAFEEFQKASMEDSTNGFFREPASLIVAAIPLAIVALLVFAPFMTAINAKAWVPILTGIGVISVFYGFFKGSWGALKGYIGFMLLFYIILRIIRAVFKIDGSVDLITPILKYGLAAIMVIVALIFLTTHISAVKTRKMLPKKKSMFEKKYKEFFVEAAYVLNRAEGDFYDTKSPLFPYSSYLEAILSYCYLQNTVIPLVTEREIIGILRKI